MSSRRTPSPVGRPRAPRPARVCVEPAHILAYPLVPLGDGACTRNGAVKRGDAVTVSFPEIDWAMSLQPTEVTKRLPSAHVIDVFAALLHYYARSDRPGDGVVRFDQTELYRDVGWLKGAQSSSGRHRQQLEDALWHLQRTTLQWTGNNAPDPEFGQPGRGILSISIVSGFRVGRSRSRRGAAEGDEITSDPGSSCWVEFGRSFVRLLRADYGTHTFDISGMLALPSGTPRALFRALTWYRNRGISSIPLRELYPRIGSVEQRLTASRAEQVLGCAHAAMRKEGILASMPMYVRTQPQFAPSSAPEEMCVVYDFAVRSASFLDPEDEVLVRTARSYGVSEVMALNLVRYRDQLRTVLNAVGEGDVTPRYPAGYIVDATRGGWHISRKHSGTGAKRLPSAGDAPAARPVAERYEDWCGLQINRFMSRPDVDYSALRAEVVERLQERHATTEAEAIRVEMRELLRTRLGLPTLDEYALDPDEWERRAMKRAPRLQSTK